MSQIDDVDMRDPSTASSRIYVGGILEGMELKDILEVFKKFGPVSGISIKRGYGFVQFAEEKSALEAISQKHIRCQGLFLLVKSAAHNMTRAYAASKKQAENAAVETSETGTEDRGPVDSGDEENPPDVRDDRYPTDRDREPVDRDWERDRGYHRGEGCGYRGRGPHHGGPWEEDFRDRSPVHRMPYSQAADWVDSKYACIPDPAVPYRPLEQIEPVEHNDCEIIVVSKALALTEYAEFIEDKLKRIGLLVDVLFPNEDVPIGQVLENISSRGCLYAILVLPQNLEHNSLTLNILHGLPQEHRNMPLDDALKLISRNWNEYQTSKRAAGCGAIMGLLKQLAAGRSLTVLQYDTVLQYVKQCREKQVKIELGDVAIDTTLKTQVDLQQRILNILNSDGNKEEAPTPAPTPTHPPILNNPSMQRALDSLLNKIL